MSEGAAVAAPEVRDIGGFIFKHGEHESQEYYDHTDKRTGWNWGIFRHKHAGGTMGMQWFAYVSEPGNNTPVRMLNMATRKPNSEEGYERKDPLFDLNACDVDTLLWGSSA